MKIDYRSGDLFKTDIKYILHGCNSRGVMGSGIAKQVVERFPEAYTEYVKWCHSGFRLGMYQAVASKDKIIINAVTQQKYGKVSIQQSANAERFVSYDAIAEIMKQLNKDLPNTSIAMPKIGSMLGGGNWNVIAAIIESELTNIQPVVYYL